MSKGITLTADALLWLMSELNLHAHTWTHRCNTDECMQFATKTDEYVDLCDDCASKEHDGVQWQDEPNAETMRAINAAVREAMA